jgi:polyhydroxyalkanoate synthesis regulator phasin
VRDLETRAGRLVTTVEKRAARAARRMLKTLDVSTRREVTALARRLDALEARVVKAERPGSSLSGAA